MAGERVSEADLCSMEQWADCDLNVKDGHRVSDLIEEIRAHRAAALTDAEREALAYAREVVEYNNQQFEWSHDETLINHRGRCQRALAALDRLLGKETDR